MVRYEKECLVLSKKLKHAAGQIAEDAFRIGSLQWKLSSMDTWIKKVTLNTRLSWSRYIYKATRPSKTNVRRSVWILCRLMSWSSTTSIVGALAKLLMCSMPEMISREPALRSSCQPQRMEVLLARLLCTIVLYRRILTGDLLNLTLLFFIP